MTEKILLEIAIIILLGITAEWFGWRFHFPSLILFLIFGFIVGPVTGIINPDELLGSLLMPVVSFSVAIILFEGGLSLKLSELITIGRVVRNLITIGVIVSWLIISVAAYIVLDLTLPISILLGAILVVTGPTVVGPLLKHLQLVGKTGSILKWEGIVIDPIGAILAVIVYGTLIVSGELQETATRTVLILLKTISVGSFVGIVFGFILVFIIKRGYIPDFLQNPLSLISVICAFVFADYLQINSGLLSVVVMGITIANQKFVNVKRIIKFKEDLRVLLIPSLFIILAARLKLQDLSYINLQSFYFLGVVIFIARPASVLVSTWSSELNWKEKLFLCWLAPRGIVAAAVSSIFALSLSEKGYPQTEYIVPVTFLVIIVTVLIYGFTASPLANYLKLSNPYPQGTLIIGAHIWAQSLARILKEEGFDVLLVDSNRDNVTSARLSGLPAYNGNILSEEVAEEIDLYGIGKLIALTHNNEVNSLSALHFSEMFGSNEVYQLPYTGDESEKPKEKISQQLRGRMLFGKDVNHLYISKRLYAGATIKKTSLTKEFDFDAFKNYYGSAAVPLFLITESKKLLVFTTDKALSPKAGQILISLVDPVK